MAGFSLRDQSFEAPQNKLNQVELAQPAIFMLQLGLFELFKTWGVYPDCVMGQSSGEVAAAYACGALDLESVTRLAYHRSFLQKRVAGSGRMLAVGLDRDTLEEILNQAGIDVDFEGTRTSPVEFACENSPVSSVICGKEKSLQPIIEAFENREIQHHLLAGNIAFHSSAMDSIEGDVKTELAFLDDLPTSINCAFISSVTGQLNENFGSDYWWSNIRQPVRFAAAMETILCQDRLSVILELAPHSALQPVIAQNQYGEGAVPPNPIPTLMRGADTQTAFLKSLGALYCSGVDLDFSNKFPRPKPMSEQLPGHPRDEDIRVDELADDFTFNEAGAYAAGPLVDHQVDFHHPVFESRFSRSAFPWAAEHVVQNVAIMPAAGYIELILQAMKGAPVHIEFIEFLLPCNLTDNPVRLQTELKPIINAPDSYEFTISSRRYEKDSTSDLHSRGRVRLMTPEEACPDRCLGDVDWTGFSLFRDEEEYNYYEYFEAVLGDAFLYGPSCQTIKKAWKNPRNLDCFAEIEIDEQLLSKARDEGYIFYPTLIDGGLQTFIFNLATISDFISIPKSMDNIYYYGQPSGGRLTTHFFSEIETHLAEVSPIGQMRSLEGEGALGALDLFDSVTGKLVLSVQCYKVFNARKNRNDLEASKHLIEWQPKFIELFVSESLLSIKS